MPKKLHLYLLIVAIIISVALTLYISQCRKQCNCPNESICPSLCDSILNILSIKNCPYNIDLPEIMRIEDKDEPIFRLVARGGLCPYGGCWSEINLKSNGEWVFTSGGREDSFLGQIDQSRARELIQLINSADFNKLRENKFTELCPTAYDGTENLYTFYTPGGEEEIMSCQTKIDPGWPLFNKADKIIDEVLRKVYE